MRGSLALRMFACGAFLAGKAWAADGDLDPTFGMDGLALLQSQPTTDSAVAVQSDNKIVSCFSSQGDPPTVNYLVLARLDADGAPDLAFGSDGYAFIPSTGFSHSDFCFDVVVQSDGKIVAVGDGLDSVGGGNFNVFEIVRFDADGVLDTTFGGGTGIVIVNPGTDFFGGYARSVALQSDGKIVVAGFWTMAANNADFMVARLLPDGTLDATFNSTGIATIDFPGVANSFDYATGVAVDTDGRIVIAGVAGANTGFGNIGLSRLTPDGHLDANFGTDGITVLSLDPSLRSAASNLVIAHDGKLVVSGGIGGSAGEYTDMAALRFLPDGILDPSFGEEGIARVDYNLAVGSNQDQDYAKGIVEAPDAKLVLVGQAGYGDMGFYEAAAARLTADGQLDDSFGIAGKVAFDFQLAFQSDQWFTNAALQGNRVVAIGTAVQKGTLAGTVGIVARLQQDRMFANGFD